MNYPIFIYLLVVIGFIIGIQIGFAWCRYENSKKLSIFFDDEDQFKDCIRYLKEKYCNLTNKEE